MIFEGGKMHQIPIQFKGWYLITDGFLRIRRRFPDGLS
jgi:hypothetical protein